MATQKIYKRRPITEEKCKYYENIQKLSVEYISQVSNAVSRWYQNLADFNPTDREAQKTDSKCSNAIFNIFLHITFVSSI